ncbi:hypothetical protein MTR67_017812 [Solanum verrucosum]|uniref:Uncharacterized protein n=1 Tax=Solanum verrucosum TaxID=315347 RepID=A0AAF0TL31_SOLVR|nr:hypothetical protein MTR67_017812 [Solanum verrucosum]
MLMRRPSPPLYIKLPVEHGYVLGKSSGGIHIDPKKPEIVQNLPRPLLPSDIQIFLGLAGYYKRFVKEFSLIALPLNTLTLKKVEFIWLEACERSFQDLKTRFTSNDFDIVERFRWTITMGVHLVDFENGSTLFRMARNHLLLDVKAKQDLDPTMVELKKTFSEKSIEAFTDRGYVFGNSKTKLMVVSFYYHCGICLTSSGSFVEFFSKPKAHNDPNSKEVQVAGTQVIGENITKTIYLPLDGDSTTDPSDLYIWFTGTTARGGARGPLTSSHSNLENPHKVNATPRAFPQVAVFTAVREVAYEGEPFLGKLCELTASPPRVEPRLVVATMGHEDPRGHGGQ